MNQDPASLKHHFLIAMPQMEDPNFSHGLAYLCEHNEDGAMGIVINQPLELTLGDVFAHLEIHEYHTDFDAAPVMRGGPVQMERGFVIHRSEQDWDASADVAEGIKISTSQDILKAIATRSGPEEHLIALGYAGWGPGQLETEMAENTWLSVAADPNIMFNTAHEERWQAAASLLGVDLSLLSLDTGHA